MIVLFLSSSREEHVELTVPLVSPQSLESTRRMLQLVEEVRKPVTDVYIKKKIKKNQPLHKIITTTQSEAT